MHLLHWKTNGGAQILLYVTSNKGRIVPEREPLLQSSMGKKKSGLCISLRHLNMVQEDGAGKGPGWEKSIILEEEVWGGCDRGTE